MLPWYSSVLIWPALRPKLTPLALPLFHGWCLFWSCSAIPKLQMAMNCSLEKLLVVLHCLCLKKLAISLERREAHARSA